MDNTGINIEQILALIEKNQNISDLHLSAWECISYRLNWEIIREESAWKLSSENMEIILKQLFQWNPQRFDKFLWDKEADFAYVSKDGIPYRVNAYLKTWRIGVVMRKIWTKARKLDEIMFSNLANSIRENVLKKDRWLFLVTWPTGCGKSTSIVSMLQEINETRSWNLITIEDPIEFIFKPEKCIISQREIWHDTWNVENALKAALRQDPDILFVWEIRDRETAEAVLYLAETWHLVFSTLHTSSAANTINRFISLFPTDIQSSVSERVSEVLLGIQSQKLVKSKDWSTRVWVFELMFNTSSVKNNIKQVDINQLDNIISTSNSVWMITMKQYAQILLDRGIIDWSEINYLFDDVIKSTPRTPNTQANINTK